jgi:predicted dehydrogenase
MERREFIRDAAATAGWTALSASRVLGANDRVVLGLIGSGGRGRWVSTGLLKAPGTEIVATCDVYDANAEQASKDLAGGKAKTFRDFRKLLEIKEIDAVYVATPDHWHAIPAVLALEAGKDVFVEKPFALTIREGHAMVEAARRTKKILMPATQQRSAPHIAEAARMVQAGEIGTVNFVRVWNSNNMEGMFPKVPDADPPAGLDWDFYLGPSPKVPFNRARFLATYRNFSDYSGGYICDYGNHRIDSVHQIMGVTFPHTISAVGKRIFLDNAGDVFDLQTVLYQYDKFVMEYTLNYTNEFGIGGRYPGQRYYNAVGQYDRPHGFAFYGSKASLYVDRIGYELYSEAGHPRGSPGERKAVQGADVTLQHAQNFIKQVRIGTKGAVDEMTGYTSTSTCHLGTIAAKVGRTLHWDAQKVDFVNDREASRLLTRTLRKPYDLIKI